MKIDHRTPLVLVAVAACSSEPQSVGLFGSDGGVTQAATEASTDAPGDTSADATTGAGTNQSIDDTADASDGETGPKFDTPGTATAADDGTPGSGCEKVDFLFVIDNSISMGDEQQNLAASFPSFIATIQNEVVDNFHVMVVDTDPADKWDEELIECYGGDCVGEEPDEPCGVLEPESGWPCGDLPIADECDAVLGAGIDHDGTNARTDCGITDGKRWFDASQPDADATFECVANLYDGNNPERTMDSMLAALDAAIVGPGGCNDGFLRDDAVLVVTFITDEEDDDESMGDPGAWYDALLARKGGNETALVVLGLVGDTGLPDAVCPPDSVPGSNGGEYSPRLIEFAESWGTRGLWGSVCSPDYGTFFEEAVALVDVACEEFEPEG